MCNENFTGTFRYSVSGPRSEPGQMLRKGTVSLHYFLPSFWTVSLRNVPVFGCKYEIIEVEMNFIDFLERDGLFLDDSKPFISAFSDNDEEYSEGESEVNVSHLTPSECFPDLNEKIKNAISNLGGTVVPKFNWTVPKVILSLLLWKDTYFS